MFSWLEFIMQLQSSKILILYVCEEGYSCPLSLKLCDLTQYLIKSLQWGQSFLHISSGVVQCHSSSLLLLYFFFKAEVLLFNQGPMFKSSERHNLNSMFLIAMHFSFELSQCKTFTFNARSASAFQ